ncbi:MAG: glycosyltransferase family 2 protein, partial [Acidimicrobiales bacterium]
MATERPSFASFILTFDRPAVLRRTIDSVLQQTELPDLLVVVDNGTDPATPAVVEEMAGGRIEYVSTGDNLGSAGGVAFGMDWLHARGFDWIHSIDDDDPPRTSDTIERL